MKAMDVIPEIARETGVPLPTVEERYPDELSVEVPLADFRTVCFAFHRKLSSPVMMLWAEDERRTDGCFALTCAFSGTEQGAWFFVRTRVPGDRPRFPSLAREMVSATLFEREIREMFGIEPEDGPDVRRLHLHDEVWPEGYHPLRKDFRPPGGSDTAAGEYVFRKIEGEGVFEVPVGPVHAGIIGPGHFRFSVAGEPVISLEIRLGFTHRGVEKIFEGMPAAAGTALAECVSGDTSFAHGLAYCGAVEKICGVSVPKKAQYLRAVFLELERLYNHAGGIGGIAVDVAFSFPHAWASIIKETILSLNERLSGSRYLKGIAVPGGVTKDIDAEGKAAILKTLDTIERDFADLREMLSSSVSFMDRVDTTGTLKGAAAKDLGVVGLAGRASGICRDLRTKFPGVYGEARFTPALEQGGDVLARLNVRIFEFGESIRLIRRFLELLENAHGGLSAAWQPLEGQALGCAEAWRGPVLYRVRLDAEGRVERCKIVDPSFHNWPGLAFSVPGNIVPDFPLCNKSFDLSYSGNDL